MLIKWIVCNVPLHKKRQFSIAQEQWRSLQNIDGFLGQIGGWDINTPTKACIIAFWKNHSSYKLFMKNKHDAIIEGNDQMNEYDSIKVEIFENNLNVLNFNISEVLQKATFLHVEKDPCTKEKQNHFEQSQNSLCDIKMNEYKDMLGWMFSNNHYSYLIASLWNNKEVDHTYIKNLLPKFNEKLTIKEHISQMNENLVQLDRNWLVTCNM
ncbi:YdbC family protein [Cytobacillus sp. IB215665]|uniref:YdbC family protein n=1 Tax=Cytobacillus sp. IB215665 TaxID=3097357 RepID=UPI002A1478A3|nr:YdbC family protein [Cytobacillus sp. IB215665]MDX8366256.1 YdbC family protein [Cytobacillus sp. IB215665]